MAITADGNGFFNLPVPLVDFRKSRIYISNITLAALGDSRPFAAAVVTSNTQIAVNSYYTLSGLTYSVHVRGV